MRHRRSRVLAALTAGAALLLTAVPGPALAEAPEPPADAGTTLIRLPGGSVTLAADPVTGRVLLGDGAGGLLVLDEDGAETDRLPDLAASQLVFDGPSRTFWAAEPAARELAAIDADTLAVRRYPLPSDAGCPIRLAVTQGMVVFISPYVTAPCTVNNGGYHVLDPTTGAVTVAAATAHRDEPYAVASSGGTLYAAERDENENLAAYTLTPGPTPTLTLTARVPAEDGDGMYWVRDLTTTPDGDAVVGGAAAGYQLVTPSLTHTVSEPQGMYGLQVLVAAAPGLLAFSPSVYGSNPGPADLYVYRDGTDCPAATYDFGSWDGWTSSDAVERLAFGRDHLYALTSAGVPKDYYLRIVDLPTASSSDCPAPSTPTPTDTPSPVAQPTTEPTAATVELPPLTAPAPVTSPRRHARHHHRGHRQHRHGGRHQRHHGHRA